jgi:DNA-binding transcriptional ArsR family regulator
MPHPRLQLPVTRPLAEQLRVIGSPTRLSLLYLVAQGPGRTLTELLTEAGLSPRDEGGDRQAVMRYLDDMARAGLVRVTYRGRAKVFHYAPEGLRALCHELCATVEGQ